MKTQKASDSFIWAGFIASWFVMSPALTSQLHLGLISYVLQDLSRKGVPIASKTLTQQSSLVWETVKQFYFEILLQCIIVILYIDIYKKEFIYLKPS